MPIITDYYFYYYDITQKTITTATKLTKTTTAEIIRITTRDSLVLPGHTSYVQGVAWVVVVVVVVVVVAVV